MALPKTFTSGERLYAEDLNSNFEGLDTRLTTAESEIDTLQSADYVPSGAVFWFAADTAPSGYLKCDGTAVSRSTYASLFAVVGETFGAGDGSTTFNLPDLRGEFVRGWDDGRGVDSGRTFGSAQTDLLEAHQHTLNGGNVDGGGGFLEADRGDGYTINTSSVGGAETRPRNVALLACIKA